MGHCGTSGHIVGARMGQGLITLSANTKWNGRKDVPEWIGAGLRVELRGPQWLESWLSLV